MRVYSYLLAGGSSVRLVEGDVQVAGSVASVRVSRVSLTPLADTNAHRTERHGTCVDCVARSCGLTASHSKLCLCHSASAFPRPHPDVDFASRRRAARTRSTLVASNRRRARRRFRLYPFFKHWCCLIHRCVSRQDSEPSPSALADLPSVRFLDRSVCHAARPLVRSHAGLVAGIAH